MGVDIRQDQRRTDAAGEADGAEDVGPLVALVSWLAWAAAFLRPDVSQAALLANAGFVLPAELDRLALGVLWNDGRDEGGKVFLCASCADPSCSGWRGRAETWLNFSRANNLPTERSCNCTPNLAAISSRRSINRQRTTLCRSASGPCRAPPVLAFQHQRQRRGPSRLHAIITPRRRPPELRRREIVPRDRNRHVQVPLPEHASNRIKPRRSKSKTSQRIGRLV
jgi:hypothetical protein